MTTRQDYLYNIGMLIAAYTSAGAHPHIAMVFANDDLSNGRDPWAIALELDVLAKGTPGYPTTDRPPVPFYHAPGNMPAMSRPDAEIAAGELWVHHEKAGVWYRVCTADCGVSHGPLQKNGRFSG